MKSFSTREKWGLTLALVIALLVWLSFHATTSFAADRYFPACLSAVADSAKWFVYPVNSGTAVDSTAGAARTDVQCYDTTISFSTDSAYYATLKVWFPGVDTFMTWVWAVDSVQTVNTTGSGEFAVVIYAIDSSGTDDTLSNVSVTVRTMTASLASSGETDTYGNETVSLDADSFVVILAKHGYTFPHDTIVVTGADTFAVQGYDTPLPSYAGTISQANVYGWIYDEDGAAVQNVYVKATRSGSCENATADSTSTSVFIYKANADDYTDTDGYFLISVPLSTEFDRANCGYWDIRATYNGETVWRLPKVWITGDFNVADSLRNR